MIHHPSCPARTPFVPAVACICPVPAPTRAQRRALRRLDPEYPLQVLGAVYVVTMVLVGLVGVLMVAGVLPAAPWSALG
jgi:hypothetical protein